MEQLWDLIVYNFIGCFIVFIRVAGIFTFNPIFGRQNVPVRIRVMGAMVLAVCMLAGMGNTTGYIIRSVPDFFFIVISEAFLGFVFGFITNMFLSTLILAGGIMDNQAGLMMANVFDPGTGIQMPIFSNFYYYLFIFYFFLTNSHLEYIRLFNVSYEIIPVGFQFTGSTIIAIRGIVEFFGIILTLAVRLAMPIIAAEIISQACVGIIMKAVPTIQVFIINIQMKIVIGLFIIFTLTGPMADYTANLVNLMMQSMGGVLRDLI